MFERVQAMYRRNILQITPIYGIIHLLGITSIQLKPFQTGHFVLYRSCDVMVESYVLGCARW